MNLPKSRRCKAEGCYVRFKPLSPAHVACGLECAESMRVTLREKQRAKAEQAKRKEQRDHAREVKAKLKAIRPRRKLVADLKYWMHQWVRLRDRHLGCISCGKPFTSGAIGGDYDAGHLRSVGSAKHLEFDERNIHGQCKHCNKYLAGNPIGYERGLTARYGLDFVEAIKADNETRKLSRETLIAKTEDYRARANQLKKDQG